MDPTASQTLLERLGDLVTQKPADIELLPFSLALLASLLASLLVAAAYQRLSTSQPTSGPIHRAFPLLAVAVTSIFICVQYSLPLSLGLLGALSIVRFRTPIKDAEDIGFLLVVIATSLACAIFNLVLVVGILGAGAVALIARRLGRGLFDRPADGSLILSFAAADYAERGGQLLAALAGGTARPRLESVVQHDDEVVLTLAFQPPAPADVPAFEGRIRALAPRSFTLIVGQ